MKSPFYAFCEASFTGGVLESPIDEWKIRFRDPVVEVSAVLER